MNVQVLCSHDSVGPGVWAVIFVHPLLDFFFLWEILERHEPDGDIENPTVWAPIIHHHQGSWEIENRPPRNRGPDIQMKRRQVSN